MNISKLGYSALILTVSIFMAISCGKTKNVATEVANDVRIKGNWLMTASEHANRLEQAAENKSMVLTFKDGKAAFSPTDSTEAKALYATLSKCTRGPRAYQTENNDLVFLATKDCPEKRVTVQTLNSNTLKFPDPDNTDITRTFTKIDDDRYKALVKASDRKL